MQKLDHPLEFNAQPGAGSAGAGAATPSSGGELRHFATRSHRHDGRFVCALGLRRARSRRRLPAARRLRPGGRLRLGEPRPARRAIPSIPISPASSPPPTACSAPPATWSASPSKAATSGPGCAMAPGRTAGTRCVTTRRRRREGIGFPNLPSDYAFVQVGGEGAHEIAVGPIHAGIIEPGHFRFSVVGETRAAPRAAARLPAQGRREALRRHGRSPQGQRLVGRISGDSTCAYAWAYASAVEAACGVAPPAACARPARPDARARARRQPPRRSRRARQRRRASPSA